LAVFDLNWISKTNKMFNKKKNFDQTFIFKNEKVNLKIVIDLLFIHVNDANDVFFVAFLNVF